MAEALFFNRKVAIEYGVEASVIFAHISFWVKHNEQNGTHLYESRYWTFNSVQAFSQQFPWWGEKVIRHGIDKLLKAELIKKGNFNKSLYDRTTWYSITEKGEEYLESAETVDTVHLPEEATPKPVDAVHLPEEIAPKPVGTVHLPVGANAFSQNGKWNLPKGQMDLAKRANGFSQKGKPIPDINININTNINTEEDEEAPSTSSSSHSFSYSNEEGATVIFSLPTSEGELTFTDFDVKRLQSTFPDLNVLSELKQMALKMKVGNVSKTLDRTRSYVTSWLINSQNKRASSAPVWQTTPSASLAPEDPNNPITHPKFDRNGNELDYNGNIIKTANQRREEREKAEEEARKNDPKFIALEKALAEVMPAPAPKPKGEHISEEEEKKPWLAYLRKKREIKGKQEQAEREAEIYRQKQQQQTETTQQTESLDEFKSRIMGIVAKDTAYQNKKREQQIETDYF